MGALPTTALHPPQLQQLHSKEATSKPFTPKPHHLPPHNQNGRLRQLQLLLLELLLRSGLLHLRQISKSFHQSTFGSIISAFTIVISTRESCEWTFGTCHEASWIAGVDRRAIDEDTRLKMEGKETSVTEM